MPSHNDELLKSLSHLAKHYARAVHWRKGRDGPRCVKEPLKRKHLEEHLTANTPPVGLAFVAPGENTTRCALFDLDDHRAGVGWDNVVTHAKRILAQLRKADYNPHVFRSGGGKGIHLILLWEEPQDAYSVRMAMADITAAAKLEVGTKGLASKEVEVFPKQDSVSDGGYGSMAILPLAGESLPLDSKFNLQELDIVESAAYWQYSPAVAPRERPVPSRPAKVSGPVERSAELIRLMAALSSIPNDVGYDEWLQVLGAIHYEFGEADGHSVALAWSERSDKHEIGKFDKTWGSLGSYSGPPTTGGTLLKMAREAGAGDDVSGMFDAVPYTVTDSPESDTLKGYDHTQESTKSNRFRIIPDRPDFIDHPEPEWLIDRVLPKADLLVIYGKSMSGKSFVALDMAYAITRDRPWGVDERRIKKGVVLYIAAEGSGGMRKRVRAYYHQYGDAPERLHFITDTPNLLDKALTTELITSIRAMPQIDLVIVDTLVQSMVGADENSGKDMGLALANCHTLTVVTGATVLLVHHAGKDESKGARGWSGLQAAADGEYEVRELESQRQLKVTKLKDDESGTIFPFRLLPVEYAINEHGEPVGSAVVEWLKESDREDGPPKLQGAWQKALYDVHSADIEGEYDSPDKLVEAAHDHREIEPNAQSRKNAARALSSLVSNGVICLVDTTKADLF